MSQAVLHNPDGGVNISGVLAEWNAILTGDADAKARTDAYTAWFRTAQSTGQLPARYLWQTDPSANPYAEYLMQLLNPGGEMLGPSALVLAATVPLPDPKVALVIAKLGWVLKP